LSKLHNILFKPISGLYYKHITIVNDSHSMSTIYDLREAIYDRNHSTQYSPQRKSLLR